MLLHVDFVSDLTVSFQSKISSNFCLYWACASVTDMYVIVSFDCLQSCQAGAWPIANATTLTFNLPPPLEHSVRQVSIPILLSCCWIVYAGIIQFYAQHISAVFLDNYPQ